MKTIEITEKDFLALKEKDLLEIFRENNSISLILGKKRIDMYKTSINYTNFIKIDILKQLPKNIYDPEEDINWDRIKEYSLNPLNTMDAIFTFKELYSNIKLRKPLL